MVQGSVVLQVFIAEAMEIGGSSERYQRTALAARRGEERCAESAISAFHVMNGAAVEKSELWLPWILRCLVR